MPDDKIEVSSESLDAVVEKIMSTLPQLVNQAVTSQLKRTPKTTTNTDNPASSSTELEQLREEMNLLRKKAEQAEAKERQLAAANFKNETVSRLSSDLHNIPAQFRSLVAEQIFTNHVKQKAGQTFFELNGEQIFDLSEGVNKYFETDSGKRFLPAPKPVVKSLQDYVTPSEGKNLSFADKMSAASRIIADESIEVK
jgi:hypothetical protein